MVGRLTFLFEKSLLDVVPSRASWILINVEKLFCKVTEGVEIFNDHIRFPTIEWKL